MSILVVDGNTMLLSKIVRSLSLANHRVRSASSLCEARELLKSKRPQVLCLDLQLPDGNGLELLDEIRSTGNEMPVVIISADHSADNRAKALTLGASGFLVKPFAISDLHAILEKAIDSTGPCFENRQAPTQVVSAQQQMGQKYCELAASRLALAKWAYSTRHVERQVARQLITQDYQPQPGDLVLAKVDKLNQHKRLELANGRRATLFIGDEIVVCYGNRYAPDQFEAEIPSDLAPCNLVAAGGIAAQGLSRNARIQAPTRITPIGVLADADGRPINLKQFALEQKRAPDRRPTITAVIGTSMNAGKTTTLAGLAHGMSRMGLKVGAAKVTGTGAGCDVWHMTDAGAHKVYDFTDCGVASTYKLSSTQCEGIMETLVAHLCDAGVDNILIEVADGILQGETRALVQSSLFARLVDNVVFAAGDALGAAGGLAWLRDQGHSVIGISGALTAAPLATRECQGLVDVPVLTLDTLHSGRWQLENLKARQRQGAISDPRAA